jgi:hypothetical protein
VPIKHPVDSESLYGVKEASVWLTERGLPTSVGSLNSWRSRGGGPRYIPIGKRRWYRESALREFLLSKLGDEVGSTSEMKIAAPKNGCAPIFPIIVKIGD